MGAICQAAAVNKNFSTLAGLSFSAPQLQLANFAGVASSAVSSRKSPGLAVPRCKRHENANTRLELHGSMSCQEDSTCSEHFGVAAFRA